MAAGGFKTFTTGEVLTTADTNNFLMQGVLVFDDATARDAAITAPVEGQVVYLKDTNQVSSYDGSTYVAVGGGSPLTTKGDLYTFSTVDARLPVGANGTILVADSSEATGLKFAAPAGGGANFTLLNAGGTSLTGAATITVSGISNKDKIMVFVDVASSASNNSFFLLRLNTDTGNNYKDFNWFGRGGTSYVLGNQYQVSRGSATNGITLSNQSDAASIMSGYVMITGAASSGDKIIHRATGVETVSTQFPYQGAGGGLYDSSSSITSISLFSGVGNFDAGTVFVYVSD